MGREREGSRGRLCIIRLEGIRQKKKKTRGRVGGVCAIRRSTTQGKLRGSEGEKAKSSEVRLQRIKKTVWGTVCDNVHGRSPGRKRGSEVCRNCGSGAGIRKEWRGRYLYACFDELISIGGY